MASGAEVLSALPERAYGILRAGGPAILVTVGEDGWGHAVMTWAAAVTPDRVRFGVDHGTATLANLRRTGRATLQVIARDAVLVLVKGAAREVRDRIVAAPFGMALWELAVSAVKDQSWGGVVVAPLTFVWTGPDADRMRLVEQHVLAELREGPP